MSAATLKPQRGNQNKKVFFIYTALDVNFLLIACGGASTLVGKWSLDSGQPTRGNIEEMELLKDGTGIVEGEQVTWKVEKDRFYFTHPLISASWRFKVSGSTLTLITDNGTSLT